MGNTTVTQVNPESEYAALRAEILQRAEFQQRTIHLAVIVAGAMSGLYFQMNKAPWILLIYPLLTFILATEWSFNNLRIRQLGTYIRLTFESESAGWEHFLTTTGQNIGFRWLSGRIYAYGIFVILPLLCMLLAILLRTNIKPVDIIVCVFDSLLTLVVTPLLLHYSE